MSHVIIITSRSSGLNLSEELSALDYEIRYTPPHDQTPADQGAKVAKILRLVNKMQEDGDA